MKKPEQRRYECVPCNIHVILYGGKTSNTAVICNCGKWMRIYDDDDRTELQNTGIERLAEEIAASKPLNAGEPTK